MNERFGNRAVARTRQVSVAGRAAAGRTAAGFGATGFGATAGLAAAVAGCSIASAGGGEHQPVRLTEPEAAFDQALSVVQTVREMPDGRVLVADPLGQVLLLVDMDAGTADTLGTVGEGPNEYQQPDAVWPLPDGRTLLVDLGNTRLTELSPELEFGETRPLVLGSPLQGNMVMAIPQAVDGEGRVYVRSLGGMASMQSDSAAVLRLDLDAEAIDTVARVKIPGTTRTGTANNEAIRQIPLSPADAWGVADDGRVVVARVADYHVEWIELDGSTTSGPPVEHDRVSIGTAEKEAWLDSRSESGGGMSISAFADGSGNVQFSLSRGGSSDDEDLESYPWPDELPPFYGSISPIPVDPSGRAWVRTRGRAGSPPIYHVFGASGEREMIVELLSGRRVVGFGDGKAYVVRMDEYGLQYLERHALP